MLLEFKAQDHRETIILEGGIAMKNTPSPLFTCGELERRAS
jgi:hypothetical protein